MSIVCTEGDRISSADPCRIHKLQGLLKLVPAPGFDYGDTADSLVDFTNPCEIKYFDRGQFDGAVKATSAESSRGHRFPKSKWMTNCWRWRDDYSICLSDGIIWVLDWTEMRWSVVKIQNYMGFEPTYPQDALVSLKSDPDSLRLVRFLPDREHCTKVELRSFTFTMEPQPSNDCTYSSLDSAGSDRSLGSQSSNELSDRMDSLQSCTSSEGYRTDVRFENSEGTQDVLAEMEESSSQTQIVVPCECCHTVTHARRVIDHCGNVACIKCIRSMSDVDSCPVCWRNVQGLAI